MRNIDWSKAPEGATHYHPQVTRVNGGISDHWFKPGFFCVVGFESGGWIPDAHPLADRSGYVERKIEWIGEGLPPVGTTCERRFTDVEGSSWMGCIILAHGSKRIFYRENCGDEFAHSVDEVEFRPFLATEQIAAERRDLAYKGMIADISSVIGLSNIDRRELDVLHALADAGYRKEVKP